MQLWTDSWQCIACCKHTQIVELKHAHNAAIHIQLKQGCKTLIKDCCSQEAQRLLSQILQLCITPVQLPWNSMQSHMLCGAANALVSTMVRLQL